MNVFDIPSLKQVNLCYSHVVSFSFVLVVDSFLSIIQKLPLVYKTFYYML